MGDFPIANWLWQKKKRIWKLQMASQRFRPTLYESATIHFSKIVSMTPTITGHLARNKHRFSLLILVLQFKIARQ